MIATVDPSRSAPAGRASRIACRGAGSNDDAVCLPPDALHHQALGQQPAARHERGHENDPPADQREPPGVIESAPEPKRDPHRFSAEPLMNNTISDGGWVPIGADRDPRASTVLHGSVWLVLRGTVGTIVSIRLLA